ncbi:MAG: thiolase family protein [Verrucomicrobia bacterium]|nr:thiolase family protein [Verrucomicrobiota bacterium]MBV9130188.1 thiolase family protein [Verrucomicrobiota bacterium]MBV9643815.1 thiolase family protein [Verrucomicrobiota bacterium]
MKEPIYIVDGVRTPFAKAGTTLAGIEAVDLGKSVVRFLVARTGIDASKIEEVIVGCVGQPADSANIGRVIALRAGIPDSVPAITVHRNCASGFEAVTQAAEKMLAGRGDIFVLGGVESMSQIPLLYSHQAAKKFGAFARAKNLSQKFGVLSSFRPTDFQPRIGLQLGLSDPVCGCNMGQTAETLSREFGILREEQDAFAMRSHHKAVAAREKLKQEITPVYLPGAKNGLTFMDQDNGPRENQTMEALAKLKPAFEPENGTVTAGNSSQITDGAAALLLMTENALKRSGLNPLGRLEGYAYAGLDPSRMGLGPVYAIHRAEQRTGLGLKDAEIIEINEAFAAQVIACQKAAKSEVYCREHLKRDTPLGEIPDEILNVNGGGIALGHPVGVTGARLVLTALKELHRRKADRALVSLCVGGGQGGALWLNRN